MSTQSEQAAVVPDFHAVRVSKSQFRRLQRLALDDARFGRPHDIRQTVADALELAIEVLAEEKSPTPP